MPDVQEADTGQAPEDTEQQSAAVSSSPKKKGEGGNIVGLLTRVAIIAAVALVAIVAAYMVSMKVLKPMLAADPTAMEVAEEEPAGEAEGGGHGGEEGAVGNNLYEMENIIVNPASTVGSRFLSCSVAFELEAPGDMHKMEAIDVKVRDALITILTARTVDELADARLREPLRRQILSRVNAVASPIKIKAVYFKDFVLQ